MKKVPKNLEGALTGGRSAAYIALTNEGGGAAIGAEVCPCFLL
ncbi:MAG: hypothetical protein ACTHJ3_14450 [Pararhizobium sp.]